MKNKLIPVGVLLILTIIIYRPLIQHGPLAWGDAPYFYPEGLKELVRENYLWTFRGTALGGINQFLWFYPVMFLYGFLHTIFGLGNDIIVRSLFYLPTIALSLITPYVFIKTLKLDIKYTFIASLVYTFNTYLILLVDGGQVGIALAYGLFPLSLLTLIRLVIKPSWISYWLGLASSLVLCLIDPRIFIISCVSALLWLLATSVSANKLIFSKKSILFSIFLLVSLIGFLGFWVIPTLSLGSTGINIASSDLQLVSLLNSLLLYQPHWPENIFGVVSAPVFYFSLIPILVFLGTIIKPNKKIITIAAVFLASAFLAKGDTPPLGQLYRFVTETLPYGVALRDSTKFFFPLLLMASLLISYSVSVVGKNSKIMAVLTPLYLALLVSPALLGNLNFNLSNRSTSENIGKANEIIRSSEGQFRVAWYPEKHPLSFHSDVKQAVDAKSLVEFAPLAALNTGDYDRFNYLHDKRFLDWYRLFGIRYLVLSGDPRVVNMSKEQKKDWDDLSLRIATESSFLKIGSETTPLYELNNTKPQVLVSDYAVGVLGGPELAKPTLPMVFFEDGKTDTLEFMQAASTSAGLYFDNKDKTDFHISLLRNNFISILKARHAQWARWTSGEYLKWRFEALIRGVDTKEFDYGLGVAFSEVENEKISFTIPVNNSGDYVLVARVLAKPGAKPLDIRINDKHFQHEFKRNNFEWFTTPVNLARGNQNLEITNIGGFVVLNAVGLIPSKQYTETQTLVDKFLETHEVLDAKSFEKLVAADRWKEVVYEQLSPVSYKVQVPDGMPWVMITQRYHQSWVTNKEVKSLPFYASTTGFYIKSPPEEVKIDFVKQKDARWGLYVSAVTAIALAILFVYRFPYKNEK